MNVPYPSTPWPPIGWHRGRFPRVNRRGPKPGHVVKSSSAPHSMVVERIEGEGWAGATELAQALGVRLDQLYSLFRHSRKHGEPLASECVLLLPYLKRYYRFTPEAWVEMFARFTERRLAK